MYYIGKDKLYENMVLNHNKKLQSMIEMFEYYFSHSLRLGFIPTQCYRFVFYKLQGHVFLDKMKTSSVLHFLNKNYLFCFLIKIRNSDT